MTYRFSFLLLSLFWVHFATFLRAQTPITQTIRGTVSDKDSKQPLTGATVMILESLPVLGANTDEKGEFRLEQVPIGRQTLKVSYYGYQDAILNELLIGAGKEVILNIELTEAIQSTDAVVITGNSSVEKSKPLNELATVSARSFTIEEASRYAGGFSDPARMASAFAGVVANSSSSNQIAVRGNSPNGLLWRLEGIEIPVPSHLSNYAVNGGAISILSSNMVGNSDFFSGAFPAEYGNAASGVFDIKLRKGNNEKHEFALQASFLGLEAAAEGPLSNSHQGSYLVNYRYSTTTFFGLMGFLDPQEGLPVFQDLSFNFNFPRTKFGNFQLFGIGGLSKITQYAITDTTKWDEARDKESYNFHSNMGIVGLSHLAFLGKNTYLKSSLAITGRDVGYSEDTLEYSLKKNNMGKGKNGETAAIASFLLNHKFNARTTLRSGFILTRRGYNLKMVDEDPQNPTTLKTLLEDKGGMIFVQAYSQMKYRFSEKLEMTGGLHAVHLTFNGNTSLEPRAGMKWNFLPKQTLSIGFGIHSRLQSTSIYFEEINGNQKNKDLKLSYSQHYVLGYDYLFATDWRLKVEAYFQNLYKVPIVDSTNSTYSILNEANSVIGKELVNKGKGRNVGMEITVEKFFTHGYYGLATISLYDSRYKAGDGNWYNTRYNGNFAANILGGKEWKLGKNNHNLIEVSGRIVVAGGNRDTPIDLEKSNLYGYGIYKEGTPFTDKMPTYFRPDFKISYKHNRKKSRQVIGLEIQNVIAHKNILGRYYSRTAGEIRENKDLSIMPNALYRIEF